MLSCLLSFDNNLLSLLGFVVVISKLVENVDTRSLSVTCCFFVGVMIFFRFYSYYFEI